MQENNLKDKPQDQTNIIDCVPDTLRPLWSEDRFSKVSRTERMVVLIYFCTN